VCRKIRKSVTGNGVWDGRRVRQLTLLDELRALGIDEVIEHHFFAREILVDSSESGHLVLGHGAFSRVEVYVNCRLLYPDLVHRLLSHDILRVDNVLEIRLMHLCMCVCVRVCVCVCVCMCERERKTEGVCMCVCVCARVIVCLRACVCVYVNTHALCLTPLLLPPSLHPSRSCTRMRVRKRSYPRLSCGMSAMSLPCTFLPRS